MPDVKKILRYALLILLTATILSLLVDIRALSSDLGSTPHPSFMVFYSLFTFSLGPAATLFMDQRWLDLYLLTSCFWLVVVLVSGHYCKHWVCLISVSFVVWIVLPLLPLIRLAGHAG